VAGQAVFTAEAPHRLGRRWRGRGREQWLLRTRRLPHRGGTIGRSMRLLDWISTRAVSLGREVSDAGSAAVYVRQLLRGNRIPVETFGEATPEPGEARPPVLLLHGYLATRGSLHLLERRLTERGHVVLTYRIGPLNVGGIRQS